MSSALQKPLPSTLANAYVPPGVLSVLERLQASGHQAYLVGGCVRDMVRGGEPQDWDIATQALPADVERLFRRVIPTGIEHGTVTVLVPGGQVEVTTYRVEGGYADGRRPDRVEFRRDLLEDLARRDFTINAMAFDPHSRELRDPFGGLEDLDQRTVRCVGDAVARFAEDGLRPLRAVRFATVLDFLLAPATEAAIPGALEVFRKVASERVREEFLKLLLAPSVERGLQLLDTTGLLGVAFPELVPVVRAGVGARVAAVPGRAEVRLAALLSGAEANNAVLERLRLPARTVDEVRGFLAHPVPVQASSWSDADVRRWVAELGAERVADALALARASELAHASEVQTHVEGVLASRPPLAVRDLVLRGQAVMTVLGVGPSPVVGEATRWLLEQVLEVPERNTVEALTKALRAWASARGLKSGPSA
jgi:tRNA nucleotidyltransferase (CCA-adding enzyme)